MRYIFILFIAATWLACQPSDPPAAEAPEAEAPAEAAADVDSMDPTVVAPDQYEVHFENDYVRVLRVRYAAGDATELHSHPDHVVVFLSDATSSMTLEDGSTTEAGGSHGEYFWSDAATHSVRAETDIDVVVIELKGAGSDMAIPEDNATTVDGDNHVVEFENDHVRVVRMTYPVGHATPPHTHLAGVNVTLTDTKGTNQVEGGELSEFEGEANSVGNWSEASPAHVTTNTGESAYSFIRVEVKGAS